MVKKLLFISMIFTLNTHANTNKLYFIPYDSEVRSFCLKNPDHEDCQYFIDRLEHEYATTRHIPNKIKSLDQNIKKTEKAIQSLKIDSNLVNEKTLLEYNQYIESEIEKLKVQLVQFIKEKQNLEKEKLEKDNEQNAALSKILKNFPDTDYEKEKEFLIQAFTNSYYHNRSQDTLTHGEAIGYFAAYYSCICIVLTVLQKILS